MVSRKHYYHSIQRQSRCKDHNYVLDTFNAAGMDETYGTYVYDECFDIRDYDDNIMIMMMILTMILMMIMIMRRIAMLLLVLLPPRPDLAMPGQAGPSQAKPDPKSTLCLPCFGMKWASDRCW